MSSTVNIISQTIKNTISIPIQALVSRPKNFEELKKDNHEEKTWDDEDYSNIEESIDVVFILVDDFDGKKVSNGEKYAIVKPVNIGLSSEDYYSVKTGVFEGELIVTGRYRVLSKDLQHGMKVSFEQDLTSN